MRTNLKSIRKTEDFFFYAYTHLGGKKKDESFPDVGARSKNPVAFNYWRSRRVSFDRVSPHII